MGKSSAKLVTLVLVLLLGVAPFWGQQQPPINPRIPPPPPPEEPAPSPKAEPASPPTKPAEPQPSERKASVPVVIPTTVVVPAGTRIDVVLDTPVSTRISKIGQLITFRMEQPLSLRDSLELPPETVFTGQVTKVSRPGVFGKGGEILVKVDSLKLPSGGSAAVLARVDSVDGKGLAGASADKSRVANLLSLATLTGEGTLLGAQIGGGKGAAVGAGAGAAIAVITMMSKRGADVYLEPGTPFAIVLDQPVSLAGADVVAANQASRNNHPDGTSSQNQAGPANPETDPSRPKLKHRPRAPQP